MVYRKLSGINDFDRIIRFDYIDAVADTNEIEFGVANRFFTRRSTENVTDAHATSTGAENRQQLSTQPYEALTITLRGKYFFDPFFGGALETGRTVAVLGCGPDIPYPASHRSLWRRICEHGLVLSELAPGTGARRWTFPARNRIVAGLCGMTVVVEAAERSGSMVTADFAVALGRDLGAVPGPVNSPLSAGPNNLLASGACLTRGAQDVLDRSGAFPG